ncbi:lactonase family protein [Persicirhabdus sediminis]|uniref:Beta-propeller fold lactonase family protein n=1 Tax=Persicirhabdus sediminis TaxID=454144 RepID=A0A8J7SIK4_9BACT|nr:beta-propeller fold lactonase family protein [Persicirhabdus sediminis]MBK1791520.1 beta-propeller fold lactonase family protein [Persicirhabdus sediminis]
MTTTKIIRTALGALSLSLLAPSALADLWVFTSPSESKEIVRYRMDEQTGELSDRTTFATPHTPWAMATDPAGNVLYVVFRDDKKVGSYTIKEGSGVLEEMNVASIDAQLAYISIDQAGLYLFGASYKEGQITINKLGDFGDIIEEEAQQIAAPKQVHAFEIDLNNRYAYAPTCGSNTIECFQFNTETGELKPQSTASVAVDESLAPRHLRFSPNEKFLYTSNQKGGSLSSFSYSEETGALELVDTASSLPAGFEGKNHSSDVQVTSNGKFAYVGNRGPNSIGMFQLDTESGKITATGQQDIGDVTRSFTITPDDKFMVVAGHESGELQVHAIDENSGKLSHLKNYPAGKGLMWVLTAPVKPEPAH